MSFVVVITLVSSVSLASINKRLLIFNLRKNVISKGTESTLTKE